MVTMTLIHEIRGTRMSEQVAPAPYARVWKQRPGIAVLGAFLTDNSRGVSAARCRRD